jgi:integrase
MLREIRNKKTGELIRREAMARLSDSYIDNVWDQNSDQPEGFPILIRDTETKGFQIRIGRHKLTWQFEGERSDHGKRIYTCIGGDKLGYFDPGLRAGQTIHRAAWHVDCDTARKAAIVQAGNLLQGTAPAAKRAGIKFADAFADYVRYLEQSARDKAWKRAEKQAKQDGNSKAEQKAAGDAAGAAVDPRWAYNVKRLGESIMIPKWANWTLSEMSERPEPVADWHKLVVKQNGPTSANHCARIIRAMFKRRAGLDRSLNVAFLPTSGVKLAEETGAQSGLAAAALPEWFAAWSKIPNATRKGYHLTNLLTGARPSQLAGCRWRDFNAKTHRLKVHSEKRGVRSYEIPTTPDIEAAIKLAATDHQIIYKSHGREFVHEKTVSRKPDDFIFPGCQYIQARNRTELPAMGRALRRTYKTIANDHSAVKDEISATLMGHVPPGMSQKYLLIWERVAGPEIKAAQATISKTIMQLLKAKPTRAAKPIAMTKLSTKKKRAA